VLLASLPDDGEQGLGLRVVGRLLVGVAEVRAAVAAHGRLDDVLELDARVSGLGQVSTAPWAHVAVVLRKGEHPSAFRVVPLDLDGRRDDVAVRVEVVRGRRLPAEEALAGDPERARRL
jgi:hypothetical protein